MRGVQKSIALALLLLLPALMLWDRSGGFSEMAASMRPLAEGTFVSNLESYLVSNIPMRQMLRQNVLDLRLFGGMREQNGIFISEEGLMKNIDPPAEGYRYSQRNTEALLAFTAAMEVPAYAAIVPTASAVLQQGLPPFVQIVNQKQIIDEVYDGMTGKIMAADVYSTLFNHREEYVYYRTDNQLTALGGYYVYDALGRRMEIENRGMEQYDIAYLNNRYYGDLYQQSPYKNLKHDTVQYFPFVRYGRGYTVTHYGTDEESKTYHTLFPTHLAEMGKPLEVNLGGLSAMVDITVSAASGKGSLLVFCDETALAYLPFLANHYNQITMVDLFRATDETLARLNVEDYGQILFAYGIETYIHTNIPSRLSKLIPD